MLFSTSSNRVLISENLIFILSSNFLKEQPTILGSLAGCRTMFLFTVFCKIGVLERNAY